MTTGGMGSPVAGSGLVVEGNEIAHNAVIYGATGDSSGTKFAHTVGLVLRNNYVHDNLGNGLWADINNLNALIEGNRIGWEHSAWDRSLRSRVGR